MSYDRDLKTPPPPNRSVWGNNAGNQDQGKQDQGKQEDAGRREAKVIPALPADDDEATTNVLVPVARSLKNRMDSAYAHTLGFTRFKSKRDFNKAALVRLCEFLEAEYNNGEPFPALDD